MLSLETFAIDFANSGEQIVRVSLNSIEFVIAVTHIMCWNFAIFGHCGIPLNFREEKTIPGGLVPLYTGGTNSRFVSHFVGSQGPA